MSYINSIIFFAVFRLILKINSFTARDNSTAPLRVDYFVAFVNFYNIPAACQFFRTVICIELILRVIAIALDVASDDS